MTTVKANISVSLEGFMTGPGDTVQEPMGIDGEKLHHWVFGIEEWRQRQNLAGGTSDSPDAAVIAEAFANVGAYVMGRCMFDHGETPWGDPPPFQHPVFVVTHRPREPLVKLGGTTFFFVPDLDTAMRQAREAAGDADITISGGASILQQAIRAGVLDELRVSVVPVLLGGGKRLFDNLQDVPGRIEIADVIPSEAVTHIRYRLTR